MKLSSLLLFPLIFFLSVSQTIQYSSVLSLAPSPSPSPFPLCHPTESSALLHFKNSFSIDYNDDRPGLTTPKTLYWKDGTNCCAWDGVLCDNISGRVISLNLSYSLLDGPFLSNNSLFLLRHLQVLILSQNDFHGSPIPSEFGGFPNLIELSLAYSNFSGLVPSELSYLSKLVTLDLSSTVTYFFDKPNFPLELRLETYIFEKLVRNLTNLMQLSLAYVNMFEVAPIFMNISSSLTYLDLSFCNLKGKFPESTFRLPSLQILSLENNIGIIGSLPTYNWSTPLRYLILSNTRILVNLPYLTRSAKFLKVLYLKSSSFTGSYPALLGNLTQIADLDLSFNGFGGQIPWSSLNLEQLRSLDLRGNNFFGQLPEVYGNNSNKIPFMYDSSKRQVVGPVPLNLQALYLSDNLLNGPIPSWTFSLPFLGALYLNENQLNGSILEFQYRSMKILNLAFNKLHGQVPSSIFQQDNLNLLLLKFNSLSGVIELNMFSKLKNLQFLSLSFNNLSLSSNSYVGSPIPQVRQLALSSCNITKFPYFLSSVENLQVLDLSHNKLQGSIPKWLWNEGTTYLSTLNLSHNLLTHVERIPWKNLMYLDLRSNLLQGHLPVLPPSIGVFFISNNQLNGEIIPSLFCNFSHMSVLDLSNNSLHGKLPSCIGNWTTLSVLDLRMNKFHGIIPDTFANTELLSLRSLHLNGNQLEGPLPRSLLNCKKLEVLDVGNNKISDTFPQWLESLMMLQVLILR